MLAVVWHFWLGLSLVIGAVSIVLSVVAGYIINIEMPRYPKKSE